MKFSRDLTLILEESRREAEERERRIEHRMLFRGLIMGLILGIVGNMFVSYWMECLKAFDIPFWIWALGTANVCLVVWYLIRQLEKESRRRPEKREN